MHKRLCFSRTNFSLQRTVLPLVGVCQKHREKYILGNFLWVSVPQKKDVNFMRLQKVFNFLVPKITVLNKPPKMSINVKYFSRVDVYSVILKSSPVGICVFSLVFGKFKHIKQKDFLLQKALSKSLSGILPSSFFILFLTLSCLFQKDRRVFYITCLFCPYLTSHHHIIPICRSISTLGSPNRRIPKPG